MILTIYIISDIYSFYQHLLKILVTFDYWFSLDTFINYKYHILSILLKFIRKDGNKCRKVSKTINWYFWHLRYLLYWLYYSIKNVFMTISRMKFPYKNSVTGEMEMFENSNAFILIPSIISWIIGFFYNKTKEKPK